MVKLNIISDSGQSVYRNWEDPNAVIQQRSGPPPVFNPFPLTPTLLDRFAPSGKHSFIETGTYKGETTLIALDYGFKFVRTCDLTFQNLSGETDKKIYSYTDRNVQTIIGDSPDVIPRVLKELKAYFPDPKDQEAVIYLDAHASGELAGGRSGGSPLLDEIYALMEDNIKTHTIFIGNRRLFGSSEWSFVSEESVLTALKVLNPNYKITTVDGYVQNDMIVASVYDNG